MLSRRDVIASFLGAAALSACRRRPAPPEVPGTLVDRLFEVGHRLRGSAPLPRAAVDQERLDCLVVGGGAAGLSAAWRLAGA
ncbi:MAG TPA: twin-arginine translocation pathway signal, partial [Archangium sp.]